MERKDNRDVFSDGTLVQQIQSSCFWMPIVLSQKEGETTKCKIQKLYSKNMSFGSAGWLHLLMLIIQTLALSFKCMYKPWLLTPFTPRLTLWPFDRRNPQKVFSVRERERFWRGICSPASQEFRSSYRAEPSFPVNGIIHGTGVRRVCTCELQKSSVMQIHAVMKVLAKSGKNRETVTMMRSQVWFTHWCTHLANSSISNNKC